MKLELVKEHDEILRRKLRPFDFVEPVMDPHELVAGMQAIRKEFGGVGLAANQVGIDARVIVIGMGDFKTEGVEYFETAYFNPIVESIMDDEIKMIEGCLSFPDLFIEIKRKQTLMLSWHDVDQKQWNERFGGMVSRILQHELDHLDGIVFTQKAQHVALEKARKNRKFTQRRRKKLDGAL